MESNVLIIVWLVSIVSAIVIGKFIYSWYAEISTRNKQAEVNNRLLRLIAKKLNATESEINEAWNA
jgi:hypothetical protein